MTTSVKVPISKLKTASNKKKAGKFLRLPLDNLTVNILDEIKQQNPYFTDLDALRWVLGRFYLKNNRQKLIDWMEQNVGAKNLPRMSEEEIFEQIKNI